MKNTVKLISGKYRGRNIQFADHPGLRPTSNRIRETVFNWLMNDILNKHCLDLYAGSGAMGFEALSRGASRITLIEKSPAVSRVLKGQVDKLSCDNARVINEDALVFLETCKESFDVVFLDPPFNLNLLEPTLESLIKHQLIHAESKIYLESEAPLPTHASLELLKQKKAGAVYFGLAKLI